MRKEMRMRDASCMLSSETETSGKACRLYLDGVRVQAVLLGAGFRSRHGVMQNISLEEPCDQRRHALYVARPAISASRRNPLLAAVQCRPSLGNAIKALKLTKVLL